MEQMFGQFLTTMSQMVQGPRAGEPWSTHPSSRTGYRVVLDEKHFKKVEKFSGGRKKDDIDYKTWMLDLNVATNKVDSRLGAEVKKLVLRHIKEDWDPGLDVDLDRVIHERYK